MVFIHALRCAEVAELVDALGSGSSARTGVGVRISPSAPQIMLRVSLRLATIGKPFFVVVRLRKNLFSKECLRNRTYLSKQQYGKLIAIIFIEFGWLSGVSSYCRYWAVRKL